MVADIQVRENQTVKVVQKIIDAKRERNVPFVGRVLKVRGTGQNKTITVRQTLEGVDVDKIFSVAAPSILSIELVEEKKKSKKAQRKAKRKTSK